MDETNSDGVGVECSEETERDGETPDGPGFSPVPRHVTEVRSQPTRQRTRTKPRIKTADDRDLATAKRRREQQRSSPHIPIAIDEDRETTDPLSLIPLTPDDEDIAAVLRSGRDVEQPVKTVELQQVIRLLKKQIRDQMRTEHASSEARAARELHALLNRAPKDVADGHSRDIALIKWVGGVIFVFLLGITGAVAKGLYDRGGYETRIDMLIDYQRRDFDEFKKQIALDFDWLKKQIAPPLPTQKGPQP